VSWGRCSSFCFSLTLGADEGLCRVWTEQEGKATGTLADVILYTIGRHEGGQDSSKGKAGYASLSSQTSILGGAFGRIHPSEVYVSISGFQRVCPRPAPPTAPGWFNHRALAPPIKKVSLESKTWNPVSTGAGS
jgi:hypothetical protein